MFTEELSGNAQRKKQEQARQRRKQLKQKQDSKKKHSAHDNTTTIKTSNSEHTDTSTNLFSTTSVASVQPSSGSMPKESSSSSDAVTRALEQRKIRSTQKLNHSSVLIIQTAYRAYISNKRLKEEQCTLLHKRTSDLITLGQILMKKQQKDTVYVPPTSLAIQMVHQLLFITHSTPRFRKNNVENHSELKYFSNIQTKYANENVKLISKILEHVVLPGILSNDVHLDPTIVWFESKEGRLIFKKLVRLSCYILRARMTHQGKKQSIGGGFIMPFIAVDEDIRVVEMFIRSLIDIAHEKSDHDHQKSQSVRGDVMKYCRNILLVEKLDYTYLKPGGITIGHQPIATENLDLIHILRSFLLYPSGIKEKPVIPANADQSRENCISQDDRERGDCMFRLVMQAVLDKSTSSTNLRSKFFAEVMTIPLLTWRIHVKTINNFVQYNPEEYRNNAGAVNHVPFIQLLDAFLHCYSNQIVSNGLSGSSLTFLPMSDVPLTSCPVPNVLCLFANLVQLGYNCPYTNGRIQSINFDAATIYFNLLAVLLDLVPLGTFNSRQSSIVWIDDGSHSKPIVLPAVILDQCKLLILDSYVRTLFNCAINSDALDIDSIINKKDSKDKKLEEELLAIMTESSTSIAAKEVLADRNKSFFQSNWAKKLSKKITSLLNSEEKEPLGKMAKGDGALKNTSSVSKQLASGVIDAPNRQDNTEKTIKTIKQSFNVNFFFALSRTFAVIISRWGGGGGEDIVRRTGQNSKSEYNQNIATSRPESCVMSLLNVLCFSTVYVKAAWAFLQSNPKLVSDLDVLSNFKKCTTPVRTFTSCAVLNSSSSTENMAYLILLMFITTLSHILIITDDVELHELSSPLPLHQIRRCILYLKNLLYRASCLDDLSKKNSIPSNHLGLSLISSSSKLLRDLHDRSSRRAICSPKLWLFDNVLEDEIRRCKTFDDYCAVLDSPVLRVCPFLVSFKRRLKLFERIISSNRESIQGRNDGFSARPGVHVHITRGRVLEDGLIHLNKLGRNLRQRIIVQYLNQAGAKEAGLDAGGLFKEFWTDLCDLAFNPNYALFQETEDGCMYPNPSSMAAHGSDSIVLFEFLGRILGKALYEGITIKPQFAHFFLSFLRGEYNFLHMLPDLSTMDQTLYNNLMFLKNYDGNAEDLCLTFSIANDDFGTKKEVELLPNGAQIDVTNTNKHRYIGLVAKHHVCDRVKEQSQAFTRGLWDVIDPNWLRIFNEPELQVLISGPSNGAIDVQDMRTNTRYTGGYTGLDRTINRFWKVIASFSKKEQADLLRFVTSCERPPPLGFSSLNPPFTIQRVSILLDGDKLPSASTCFNILKLPTYSSEKVLRNRLLYAIEAGAGFELT